MKKVVLAYSGGLDTSYCVKYLSEEMGLEVYTALANTGDLPPVSWPGSRKRRMPWGRRNT